MEACVLDRVSCPHTVTEQSWLIKLSESFWGYMQTHWETDLNASSTITVEGDTIPPGESAFVIGVSAEQDAVGSP